MAAGLRVFRCFFSILACAFHKLPRPQRGSRMPDPWLRYTLGQGVSKVVPPQLLPSQCGVGELPLQSAPEEGSGVTDGLDSMATLYLENMCLLSLIYTTIPSRSAQAPRRRVEGDSLKDQQEYTSAPWGYTEAAVTRFIHSTSAY